MLNTIIEILRGKYIQRFSSVLISAIEGIILLFEPTKFKRLARNENPVTSIARFIICESMFHAACILFLSQERNQSFSSVMAKSLVLAFILLAPTALAITCSLWVLRFKSKIALLFGAILVVRTILLFPVLGLHFAFIVTENYTFALLRGVALYFSVIALSASVAIYSSETRVKRAGGSILVFMMLILTGSAVFHFNFALGSASEKMIRASFLFDPIGDEVDSFISPLVRMTSNESYPKVFRKPIELIRQAYSKTGEKSGVCGAENVCLVFSRSQISEIANLWASESLSYKTQTRVYDSLINYVQDSARYLTTKVIAKEYLELLEKQRAISVKFDSFAVAPNGSRIIDLADANNGVMQAGISVLEARLHHQKITSKLIRYQLIIPTLDK